MKRWGMLLLAGSLLAAGCGDDNSPTSPSATAPLVFGAELSPASEVPAITNGEAGARGAVQVTMNVTRDSAGAITAATARFEIQVAGLPTDTTFVGAHIHPGVAGVNGSVIVNTTLSGGTPPTLVNGTATWSFPNIVVSPTVAQQLIDNPSAFYFNVHTFTNPGGMARGQLRRAA
jgi:hypothetical protein